MSDDTVVDPGNGETTQNYSTPSSGLLSLEATAKIAGQGLQTAFSNVTQALGIKVANGSAMAVNSATGNPVAPMGTVITGNSVPATLLPNSPTDQTLQQKVTISQEPVIGSTNTVIFEVMPTISENREAEYTPFQPLQHPGEILKYKGTSSRSWGVHGKLVSRNSDEATANLAYINLIRSWVMPFYGTGTGDPQNTPSISQYLGAPPPILTLSAYGPKMIGPVKCVLMSYNWDWPNECDYIYALDMSNGAPGVPVPFPVVVDVTMSLKESWSPAEYSKFDLVKYRQGDMTGAFGGSASSQSSASGKSNNTSSQNPNGVDQSQPQTQSSNGT